MRKWIALVTALLMVFGVAAALGETAQKAPDFIMEGYDGDAGKHNWETNWFFSRMQEKTGISFQFRQYGDFDRWKERKKLIGEGEDLPDVLFKAALTVAETRDWYQNGTLIDLRPYLEEYAPDLWALLQAHPDWLEAITLEDGAIAALPNFNTVQSNDLMWLNTDWLNRLGLEMPRTAEELTEVLRQFKTRDPNRNGRADEVPLAFIGMWELRFLGHAFGIADNDDYVRVTDGEVTSSLTAAENRNFLTWLHQLWTEGLLDHNGFNTTDNLRQITDEKATIPYGVLLSATPLSILPSAALEQYHTLEPLEYNGQKIYRDLLGDVIRGTFAITKECKEPVKLIAWVNTLYTEEGSRLAQCGLEGEEYIWNEDGYWEWNMDLTTVANEILPERTISEGGTAPGLTSEEFQLKYSDRVTRETLEQMMNVKQYSVYPYPYVTFSAADEARLNEIRAQLMPWAEGAMACFVTGDTEMNDETWNDFCRTAEEKGLNELIGILAKYVK